MSQIREENIILSKHVKKRFIERNIDKNIVYDCLINHEAKGILEQKEDFKNNNKYKIFYEDPNNQSYDIIVIVSLDSGNIGNISIVTAFIQKRDRRVK